VVRKRRGGEAEDNERVNSRGSGIEPETDADTVGRGPNPDTHSPDSPDNFYTQDAWLTTAPDAPLRTDEEALAAEISALMAQARRALTRRPGDPRTLEILLRAAATLRRLSPNNRKKLEGNLMEVLKNFHHQFLARDDDPDPS